MLDVSYHILSSHEFFSQQIILHKRWHQMVGQYGFELHTVISQP